MIPHVMQSETWDCGLACVAMVVQRAFLRGGGGAAAEEALQVRMGGAGGVLSSILQMAGTSSVWTIDLAYILRRCGIDCVFCTNTIGVDPNYLTISFYRGELQNDTSRVDRLFAKAAKCGVRVVKGSVSADAIGAFLSHGRGPAGGGTLRAAIVLVDLRYLTCKRCLFKRNPFRFAFAGHYILVTRCTTVCGAGGTGGGGSSPGLEFYYRDPSSSVSARECVISAADFDRARQSYGTDEDILLLNIPCVAKGNN